MRKRRANIVYYNGRVIVQLIEVTSQWGLLEMCLQANLVLETHEK